jgi:hypothetical protein
MSKKLLLRIALASSVSIAITQLGLRWQAAQPIGQYTVIVAEQSGQQSGAVMGELRSNFSGDFVLATEKGEITFRPAQVRAMAATAPAPVQPPWRLIACLVFAAALGSLVVLVRVA